LKLSRRRAAAWRVRQQHLDPRSGPGSRLGVVSRLCGLHAQVMSCAGLIVWSRVEGLERVTLSRLKAQGARRKVLRLAT